MKSAIESFTQVRARIAIGLVAILFLYLVGAFQATTAANGPQQPNEVIITQCTDFGGAILVMTPKNIDAGALTGSNFEVYNDSNSGDAHSADNAGLLEMDGNTIPYMVLLTSFSSNSFSPDGNNDTFHIEGLTYTDASTETGTFPIFISECDSGGGGAEVSVENPRASVCTNQLPETYFFVGFNEEINPATASFEASHQGNDLTIDDVQWYDNQGITNEYAIIDFTGTDITEQNVNEFTVTVTATGVTSGDSITDGELQLETMDCGNGGGDNNDIDPGSLTPDTKPDLTIDNELVDTHENSDNLSYHKIVVGSNLDAYSFSISNSGQNPMETNDLVLFLSGEDGGSPDWANLIDSTSGTCLGLSSQLTAGTYYIGLATSSSTGDYGLTFTDSNTCGGNNNQNQGGIDLNSLTPDDNGTLSMDQPVTDNHASTDNLTYRQVTLGSNIDAYSFIIENTQQNSINTNEVNLVLVNDDGGNPDWSDIVDSTDSSCLGNSSQLAAGTYYIGLASTESTGDFTLHFSDENNCGQGGGGNQGIDPETLNPTTESNAARNGSVAGHLTSAQNINLHKVVFDDTIDGLEITITGSGNPSLDVNDVTLFFFSELAPDTPNLEYPIDDIENSTLDIGTSTGAIAEASYYIGVAAVSSTGNYNLTLSDTTNSFRDLSSLNPSNQDEVSLGEGPANGSYTNVQNINMHVVNLQSDSGSLVANFSSQNMESSSLDMHLLSTVGAEAVFNNPVASVNDGACLDIGTLAGTVQAGTYYLAIESDTHTGNYALSLDESNSRCIGDGEDFDWENATGNEMLELTENNSVIVDALSDQEYYYHEINIASQLDEFSIELNTENTTISTGSSEYALFGDNGGNPATDSDPIASSIGGTCLGSDHGLNTGTYYYAVGAASGRYEANFYPENRCAEISAFICNEDGTVGVEYTEDLDQDGSALNTNNYLNYTQSINPTAISQPDAEEPSVFLTFTTPPAEGDTLNITGVTGVPNQVLTFEAINCNGDAPNGPTVDWMQCHADGCIVALSDSMDVADITNVNNLTLTSAAQGEINLSAQGTVIGFNPDWNELEIFFGQALLSDQDQITLEIDGSVQTADNQETLSTAQCSQSENRDCNEAFAVVHAGGTDVTDQDGYLAWNDPDAALLPTDCWPDNLTEGVSTDYSCNVPIDKQLSTGAKVILEFSNNSIDLSNAQINTNESIAGGQVNFSAISIDNSDKRLTLTVNGTTAEKDVLNFRIQDIVNGDADEEQFDWNNYLSATDAGNYITVSTKNANNQWLEQNRRTAPFPYNEGGDNSLTITVYDDEGQTVNADDAIVVLIGHGIGEWDEHTDANGQVSFTGLVEGSYDYFLEPNTSGLSNTSPKNIKNLNGDITRDITVTRASNEITGTIYHNGIGDQFDVDVLVYAAGHKTRGWYSQLVTLDNDGETDFILYADNDKYSVGVKAPHNNSDDPFLAPGEQIVKLNNNDKSGLQFYLSPSDSTINVTVIDRAGEPLAGIGVNAYNPASSTGGDHKFTNPNGQATLSVREGEWLVSANKFGFPDSKEYVVEIDEDDSEDLTITLGRSENSVTVTGNVTNGDTAIEGIIVNCWNNTGTSHLHAFTNSSGTYRIFPEKRIGETWSCEAFSDGRPLAVANGVDNYDFNLGNGVSGMNFTLDDSQFSEISGTAPAYTSIWAEAVPNDNLSSNEYDYFGRYLGAGFSDEDGNIEMTIQNSNNNENVILKAWSPSTGDLTPVELGAVTSDRSNIEFESITLHEIEVGFTANDVDEDIEIGDGGHQPEIFIDFFDERTGKGNGASLKEFEERSVTGTITVPAGSYQVNGYIEGIGFIYLDDVEVNQDLSLEYDMSEFLETTEYSGTVTSGGAPLTRAWVDVYNPQTGGASYTQTNAQGEFSLYLKPGTWMVSAHKTNYASGRPLTLTPENPTQNISLSQAGETISGSITLPGGISPESTYVWAENENNEFASAEASNGEYTISVPENSGTWTVYASNHQYEDTTTAVAGDSNANIQLQTQVPWYDEDFEPKSSAIKGSTGGVVTADGVEANIPANALNNEAESSSVSITNSPAPKGKTKTLVGNSYDVDATDADGNPITDLQAEMQITLEYNKRQIDTLIENGKIKVSSAKNDLESINAGYWNASNGDWLPEPTTRSITVQRNEGDEFVSVDYQTAISPTTLSQYNDYVIKLKTSTDHLTIFGAITGSDSEAPASPTLSTPTVGESSIVLDWNDNTEPDFMEYLVYRGTDSGFETNDESQINTSQVTASTFTDTTMEDGVEYHYKVQAVDTSGNESGDSNFMSATWHSDEEEEESEGGSSSGGGGGNGGGGSASNVVETPADESSEEESNEENAETEDASTVEEAPFEDTRDHWAQEYISDLYGKGIVNGINENTFDPDKTITRAEFTKIVMVSFGFEINEEFKGTFEDVTTNDWYALIVETAADNGIVNSGGTFRPDAPITRAAALRILLDASNALVTSAPAGPFTDVPQEAWFADYVNFAYAAEIVSGKTAKLFAPADNVTRAETSKIVSEMIKQGFTE